MNIAIWGMGVSGISTLKYLSHLNLDQVFLVNQGSPDSWARREEVLKYAKLSTCYSEIDAAKELQSKIDLIVLAPGIDPKNKYLQTFKDVKKICEIEFACQKVKAPIIALTGTNGKTTTVTMIAEALKLAGKSVFLGGNIGRPLCEIFLTEENYDFVVLELSSFQLELMDAFRADIAVILNITKSHMERYESFEDYKAAKLNIIMNQNESDLYISPKEFLSIQGLAQKSELLPSQKYDFSKSKLIGEHYKLNVDVIDKVLNYLKIENSSSIIQSLINKFNGVEFRLEFKKEYKDTRIYNDGKSTNTAATISAVNSFKTKRVCLILGGKLRDLTQDFSSISTTDFEKLEIYSFGEAAEFVGKQFDSCKIFEKLEDVVRSIDWQEFEVVLFSPAFPSFDHYKNYIERGKHFDELIGQLQEE